MATLKDVDIPISGLQITRDNGVRQASIFKHGIARRARAGFTRTTVWRGHRQAYKTTIQLYTFITAMFHGHI